MIRLAWAKDGPEVRMIVDDNGPGFPPPQSGRRASGLGLVRGLLRQLGGSLEIVSASDDGRTGARCMVRFPVPGAQGRTGDLA